MKSPERVNIRYGGGKVICPKCHAEYTSLNPCSCPTRPLASLMQEAKEGRKSSEGESAYAQTGLNNPFWEAPSRD